MPPTQGDGTMSLLYKVLTEVEWEVAQRTGVIETALDAQDGYVHLSSAHQLPLTLARYFDGHETVVLLAVDRSRLGESLVFESSPPRPGAFPHVYGSLRAADVIQQWILTRQAFELPEQVLAASEIETLCEQSQC
jgi:uncharacterized protein (DUF952 family)